MIDKEKQIKRQNSWKAKLDRIEIYTQPGTKDAWKAQAKAEGLSLTEWIIKKCQGD